MLVALTADSSNAGVGFAAEFSCGNFDPCFADMGACDEAHPGLNCTGCRTDLPTAQWISPGGFATPAEQFPTIRDVCAAACVNGVCTAGSFTNRTAKWLELAQDYHLQTADGNALVIARQLCLERRFSTLQCLGDPSGRDDLAELHDQACALADLTDRSEFVGAALRPNEIKPLAAARYEDLFNTFMKFI